MEPETARNAEVFTIEDNDDTKVSSKDKKLPLLYRVDESPPWQVSLLIALQQLLMSIGLFLTFPLLMMGIMCADDSPEVVDSRAILLSTQIFHSGLATFIQITFGVRLCLIQGLTAAYFIPALAIMSTDRWKCPGSFLDLNNTIGLNYTVSTNENATVTIYDQLNNASIIASSQMNYYRDNDGSIRSSSELWLLRIREIQGAVIVSGLVQIVIGFSGLMGFLLRFIGPLTIAPTLTLITYAVADTAKKLVSAHWGIAFLIVAIFFVCSVCLNKVNVPIPSCDCRKRKCSTKRMPVFSMFPILFAIFIGWLLCYIITVAGGFSDNKNEPSYKARTDTKPGAFERSPWFSFPYPFQWGAPTFTISSIFGMMAAIIPGILESIGDYNAAAIMSQEPLPPRHAVNRGILAEGFGILMAGLWGTANATTTYSPNIVVIGITRVASRRAFQVTAFIFVLLGIFTKFSSLFVSIPGVVLGGTMLGTSGMILALGVSTLHDVDMKSPRNLFIFGFSVFIGITASTYVQENPDAIDVGVYEVNQIFLVLLRTPMFIGGVFGFILDNIAPGTPESRGLSTFSQAELANNSKSLSAYQLPFNKCGNYACTKWIPICPNFGSK